MTAALAASSSDHAYTLTQVDADTYEISGPDNRFSLVRFLAQMPEGPWWTEWVGAGEEFILRLTR